MDLTVTIKTSDGDIEMPFMQAVTMSQLIRELEAEGKTAIWHQNECDCCITVHAADDHHRGWVIGQDGGADLVEVTDPTLN